MGILGLLQELKSISKPMHTRDLKGLRVAIDGHCWLHKGSYSCARELVLDQQSSTPAYIKYMVDMINMLKTNGVHDVLIVFDGCALPSKLRIHQEREASRMKHTQLALSAEKDGNLEIAWSHYRQSVTITFDMIKKVTDKLNELNVAYLISPYESDAQLTFLSNHKLIDCVISDDSDLIVYGCRHIIYKLDKSGYGVEIKRHNLALNTGLSFLNWTDKQFKLFCCLSGCDYVKNINMIGIRKAYKLVEKYNTLPSLATYLRRLYSSSTTVDINMYLRELEQAILIFYHQTIYNPLTMQLEYLNPLPPMSEVFHISRHASREDYNVLFLGPQYSSSMATDFVLGKIDPVVLKRMISNSDEDHLNVTVTDERSDNTDEYVNTTKAFISRETVVHRNNHSNIPTIVDHNIQPTHIPDLPVANDYNMQVNRQSHGNGNDNDVAEVDKVMWSYGIDVDNTSSSSTIPHQHHHIHSLSQKRDININLLHSNIDVLSPNRNTKKIPVDYTSFYHINSNEDSFQSLHRRPPKKMKLQEPNDITHDTITNDVYDNSKIQYDNSNNYNDQNDENDRSHNSINDDCRRHDDYCNNDRVTISRHSGYQIPYCDEDIYNRVKMDNDYIDTYIQHNMGKDILHEGNRSIQEKPLWSAITTATNNPSFTHDTVTDHAIKHNHLTHLPLSNSKSPSALWSSHNRIPSHHTYSHNERHLIPSHRPNSSSSSSSYIQSPPRHLDTKIKIFDPLDSSIVADEIQMKFPGLLSPTHPFL